MKVLSISDLRKFDGPQSVWVLNTTANSPTMRRNYNPETGQLKQERADVIINVSSATVHGERETITFPQSFLPIDITEYVSIRDILECRPFLKAVREGLLTIIDQASADELFETPGAEAERDRLVRKAARLRDIGSAPIISKSEVLNVSNPSDNETPIGKKAEVVAVRPIEEVEEDQFDATFVANVIRWTQMEDLTVLNEMRTAGRFSRKELKYVVSKLDKQKHKATINHIRSKLEARKVRK